jgi:hypothetical protein
MALRSACLIGLLAFAAAPSFGKSQEKPIQKYFRVNGYTPIVNHASYIVPGGFVIVDWVKGGSQYYDPKADGLKLSLDLNASDTEQLDQDKSHKETSMDAAIASIAQLLGYKPGISISGGDTFDFSGVNFKVKRLSDDAIDGLINNEGLTKSYMLSQLKFKIDMYLVQAVDYTDSFSLTTSSTTTVSLSTSGAAETCKNETSTDSPSTLGSTKGGTTPKTASNTPAQATAKTGGVDNTLTTAVDAAKTVEQLIPATKTATDKSKSTSTSSLTPSATLKICHDAGDTTIFKNGVPVPTAMHLVSVYTGDDGNLHKRVGTEVTVPMGDPDAVKRNGVIHKLPTYWTVHQ